MNIDAAGHHIRSGVSNLRHFHPVALEKSRDGVQDWGKNEAEQSGMSQGASYRVIPQKNRKTPG
ncbi:hypothetical protein [Tritonibacter horizontis]|uniref:hypothetical protein n=1 Tax=Tritonibacter horizontis TaxID=1768241 RepID=UPI001041DC9B|nr:hypothetical protein [Tritonibacter horizontis]